MFRIVTKKWWKPEQAKAAIMSKSAMAARECAEFIADQARVYVPKDTLFLMRSIQVISSPDNLRHWVIATAPYAEPVEFGYTHYLSGKRIPPQPFLRKAVRDGAAAFPRIIGETRVRQGHARGAVMGAEVRAV